MGRPSASALLARSIEQSAGDVHAGHRRAAPRDEPRCPTRSGGQVENPLARLRVESQHAMLDSIGDASADLVVISSAGAPHGRRPFVVGLYRARL